jgi:mRNA interferase MazF
MEKFMKGDVIVVLFPFSDLTSAKRRPALIVAELDGDDFIIAQITGANRNDSYSVVLKNSDFKSGSLNQLSLIRPNKLFTADKSIIDYKAGSLHLNKIKEVDQSIIKIFSN